MTFQRQFARAGRLVAEFATAASVTVPRSYYNAFKDYGSEEKVARHYATMFPVVTAGLSLATTAAIGMLVPQTGALALAVLAFVKWNALSVYLYKEFAADEKRMGNHALDRHNRFFPSLHTPPDTPAPKSPQ